MKNLLDITYYGFSETDLDKTFIIDLPNMAGLFKEKKRWTLREVRSALENAYCGKVGVEYMHMTDPEETNWIRNKFELRQYKDIPNDQRILILDRLLWADEFIQFIG
jgi:2-oxoglutarate dehydrogenase E1 component